MATILDTLITRFGFETDKTGLDKAEKGLSNFKASAIKIAAAVGGILGGSFFLNAIAETADETLKWADANGLVIETLGELEFATQRQGGTIEGLRASLTNINRAIGEVERGTGRAKLAFEDYGLSVKKANGITKTADELLVDLNKKFATLSKAQQFDLAMKMGIDKGTIRLLQTAPDEIARLRLEAAKLGVLSRQDAVAAALFVDGMTNIAQAINAIKFEIGGLVFEPLSKMFKEIAKGISFARKHKDVFVELIKILGFVGAAYLAMGVRALIAWALAFAPLTILIGAIGFVGAAMVILRDDFEAWRKGSNSAIGDAIKKFPILKDIIDKTAGAMQALRDFKFKAIDVFLLSMKEVGKGFGIWWDWLVKINNGITKFLLDPINTLSDAIKKLPALGDKFGKMFGMDKIIGAPAFQTPAPIGVPSSLSPVLTKSNRAVSSSNQIRIDKLSVDARGGDSKEIAQNVSSELESQLKNMVEDVDSDMDK